MMNAYLSICTYCHQAVDIRQPGVMRRTISWVSTPVPPEKVPQVGAYALPVLLNEWGHHACIIERANLRAEQVANMGEVQPHG
jgi:hypothetical protein